MPEERICPVCGRANALAHAQCSNCGRSVSSGGSVLLMSEEEQTVSDVGSRLRTSTIPVPPQIRAEWEREEIARRDRELKEAARRAAVEESVAAARAESERRRAIAEEFERQEEAAQQRLAAAERAESLARRGAVVLRCGSCGARTDAATDGVSFSFCAVCGADLPRNTVVTATSAEAGIDQTVVQPAPGEKARSYREQMNERRARYAATAATAPTTGRTSTRRTGGARIRSRTAPAGPAAFSFFLPGGGQMVNGQIGKGIFILLAYLFAMSALSLSAWGILMVIARVLVALDAYRIAERRSRGESVREWEWDIQD